MTKLRIYTYKVTFEEIPHWYWGVHKEKRHNDGYLGSPKTHKWMWEFYTPKIQILEFFTFTDEGWANALEVEQRLIRPDLNNPFCLNERCGATRSLKSLSEAGKKGCAKLHSEKDELGRSVHALKSAEKWHKDKDEFGRSLQGLKGTDRLNAERDEFGRSVVALAASRKAHSKKDEQGRSLVAVRAGEAAAKVTNKLKFRCLITGHVTTPGPLTVWQRSRGIDTSLREKINEQDDDAD